MEPEGPLPYLQEPAHLGIEIKFHTHVQQQENVIVLYILIFTFFDSRWE
jgi:hypothetical protein